MILPGDLPTAWKSDTGWKRLRHGTGRYRMRTEAWWVCHVCNKAVQKVGKGGGNLSPTEGHRKVCPTAGYSIEQILQSDLPERRFR